MESNKSKRVTKILLVLYLIFITWVILFKMSTDFQNIGTSRRINLKPFGASVIINIWKNNFSRLADVIHLYYICTIKFTTMDSVSSIRKQTSFRLNANLLDKLQEEAKRHNRSLNNLVESVLMAFVAERPNKTTLAAMKEAETSDNLETLDLSNFRSFVDSL